MAQTTAPTTKIPNNLGAPALGPPEDGASRADGGKGGNAGSGNGGGGGGGASLTDRAASGFAFFAVQTVAFKGASLVGQVVLAWLLTEGDFGLFAMCGTIAAFIELLQQGGLREVLIRRQRAFRVWGPAAFWMSLSLGLLGAAIMAGAGPIVARFYGNPELAGLLAVLALSCPLSSINTVPMARLQIDLRFRLLASVAAVVNIGQLVCTIIFALLGLGAYSFVLARVVMPIVQAAIVWPRSGVRLTRRPHLRRWRYLFGDSALLLGTWYLYTAVAQGDKIVLGRWTGDADLVGLYAFALFVSIQTIQIVTSNLEQIFFPTLSAIRDDPERQTAAFVRASRLLALAAAPACLFQAALADPAIRLVFDPKWRPAIPAAQILSIGMLFLAIAAPAYSLLRAQGRFRTLLFMALASVAIFFATILSGAWLAGPGSEMMGVAVAMGVYQALMSIAVLIIATSPAGRARAAGVRDVASILSAPVAASALAIGGAWAASLLVPAGPARPFIQIAIVLAVGGPLYLALARLMMPGTWKDLHERVGSMLGRLHRRRHSALSEAAP